MILPMVKMDVILDANDHLKNTFSDQQASFSLKILEDMIIYVHKQIISSTSGKAQ